ncbi:LysR family transcriptional regulator [Pseudomonas shirazica]|nr:LysR family transcriptional regulator [Pseudomonas shirazica]
MRRFLPSLSALQAFEAAARHLSFTRAAEDLQITQSGVSRQISNLERQLGVELFQRAGSRLILTDAGRTYLRDVDQMLNQLEEVTIDLVRGRKADLSLMVGGNPTFLSRWLIPRLEGFFTWFPGCQLTSSPSLMKLTSRPVLSTSPLPEVPAPGPVPVPLNCLPKNWWSWRLPG